MNIYLRKLRLNTTFYIVIVHCNCKLNMPMLLSDWGHFTLCNALAVIGKRFEDAGLRDMCIESGVVAESSVKGVLEGKMYNRAIRVHKVVSESMMRLI